MSKPIKVIFLGAKKIGYDCLLHLINNATLLNLELTAVLGKENKLDGKNNVKGLAVKYGIPFLSDTNDLLNYTNVDYLISVQYNEILKQEHIDIAGKMAINLHMAPLPEYRGCNQFTFAILEDSPVFGTTLHELNAGIDTGDILFESRFDMPKEITVKELYELTLKASLDLFSAHIADVFKGEYKKTSQKELAKFRSSGFHLRSEMEAQKLIDLTWPKEKIKKQVRATYFPPFDPPYAIVNGEKINITPIWIEKNL